MVSAISVDQRVHFHLRETSRKHAARWLGAANFHIPRALFGTWLRRRILARHSSEPDRMRCGCGSDFDFRFIAHVVGCARRPGNNSTKKHHSVVDLLTRFCSEAGVIHEKEPRGFQSYKCHGCGHVMPQSETKAHKRLCKVDLIRSGPDIRAWMRDEGENDSVENFYDYTTLHMTAPSHLRDLIQGTSPKTIADRVVSKKCDTYRANFPAERFIVIIAYELGGLDKPLADFVCSLAHLAGIRPSLWLDELCVTIAAQNADAIWTSTRMTCEWSAR